MESIKPTILVYTNSYHKKSETFVINHINQLTEKYDVIVVTNHSKTEKLNANVRIVTTKIDKGVAYRLFKTFISFKWMRNVWNKRNFYNGSLLTLYTSIKNLKYDYIYAHFGQNAKLIWELEQLGLVNKPTIGHFHGLDFTLPIYQKKYYNSVFDTAETLICGTEFAKKKLIKIGFDPKNISVIPAPVYFEGHNTGEFPETFNILFVTRFIELKGVLELKAILKQLEKLNFTKYKLTLIGDGPLLNEVQKDLKTFSKNVEFKGRRNQEEILEELKKSHITIYPGVVDKDGREESQCLAIQEGFAFGLPTVAFDVGGISESVIDKQTGFLIKRKDHKAFAEAILNLATKKDLYYYISSQAYLLYKSKYEKNQVFKVHQILLDQLKRDE